MSLNQFKVSTRLALGFGSATILGIAIAIIGALQMRSLAGSLDHVAKDLLPKVDKIQSLKDDVNEQGRFVRNIVIIAEPSFRQAEKARIVDLKARNAQLVDALDKVIKLPRGRELLRQIQEAVAAYQPMLDKTIAMAEAGESAHTMGEYILSDLRPKQTELFKLIDQLREFQFNLAEQAAADGGSEANSAALLLLLLAGAMGGAGGLVGWLIARSLTRALGAEPDAVSEAVQRVADGDLATPVVVRAGDTTSVMATVQRMQRALSGIVRGVRANAEGVATASAQIAQGNLDLSQRTEEQASALEETSATMTQLSTTVRGNSDSARQANQLALSASGSADKGGEAVGRVVETMKGINESSRKIADIISVIDGIAFQTNILALNAAVEAARAGEQGRGFAVVAGEVRNLAQRSAEAAKEIKTLITQSVGQVDQGGAIVDEAGQSMEEIVRAIRRVADIVGEISAASVEQSTGVAQVETAVCQMDQTTQQNAALVEEGAAAAASLRTQAAELVQAVAVFKVDSAAA
jgi:methyl-accepting chemotaxis protein